MNSKSVLGGVAAGLGAIYLLHASPVQQTQPPKAIPVHEHQIKEQQSPTETTIPRAVPVSEDIAKPVLRALPVNEVQLYAQHGIPTVRVHHIFDMHQRYDTNEAMPRNLALRINEYQKHVYRTLEHIAKEHQREQKGKPIVFTEIQSQGYPIFLNSPDNSSRTLFNYIDVATTTNTSMMKLRNDAFQMSHLPLQQQQQRYDAYFHAHNQAKRNYPYLPSGSHVAFEAGLIDLRPGMTQKCNEINKKFDTIGLANDLPEFASILDERDAQVLRLIAESMGPHMRHNPHTQSIDVYLQLGAAHNLIRDGTRTLDTKTKIVYRKTPRRGVNAFAYSRTDNIEDFNRTESQKFQIRFEYGGGICPIEYATTNR